MLKIIETVSEWKTIRNSEDMQKKTIGFIPTMGAIHKGHESLFEKSVSENEISVVSIFVNPTQFNDPNDYENYPKTFNQDLEILKQKNIDFLFYPSYKELYPDNFSYKVIEENFSKELCGAFRPNHFDGVLTVVLKLFNIIKPHVSYFGEKDFQQLQLVKKMCESFFMDVKIIGCPTVREPDGLAMSSRNLRLTKEDRNLAVNFPRLLSSNKKDEEISEELKSLGFKVDYITTIEGRRFGAVHLGKVRLIDNVQL